MPIDVNSIIDTIKTEIIGLAQTSLKNYLPQAKADAENIANAIKADVQDWSDQLTSGEITPDDLKFLIAGDEELLKIDALTQAGIAEIQLDQFKQGVTNIIVNTLSAAIKV